MDESSGGADPISAIANAVGGLFNAIGGIWTSINDKKIAKEQTKQLSELTTQERIKYDELISSGNYALASQLLSVKNSEKNAANTTTYLILGATFLIVMIIVYKKINK